MKFAFSIPSLLAHASSILLLSFSLPLIAQVPASNNSPDCKVLIQQNPNSVEDFLKIGHYQSSCLKDSQAAVSSFTKAIELNPKAEEPYYHRANAYQKLGNYKAAVADYTKVISRNRGGFSLSDVAYWNRARAYEKLDEKQKAISDWTQVISKSQNSAEAYFRRANMYRDLEDKENAINDYKVADKILRQYLNGVFGNGHMNSINEKMLDKVRTELSQLGVSLPAPQLTTANILKSIAEIEVERALNSARFNPQNPTIQHLDAKLQDLYKQLDNTQPQPLEGIEKSIISNAAYRKIEDLKIQKSRLTKKFTSKHPQIVLIDKKINQLEALSRHNRK